MHAIRTISERIGLNNFEFLANPRIEKTSEIKSVRTFLPPREIRYFVSVNDVAFCSQLVEVAYFRVDGGQKEARVRDGAVTDIARTIIPCETDTCEWFVAFSIRVESRCALSREELHYAGN